MKFMVSFHDPQLSELVEWAENRHCSIQELLRVVIIPEWKANHLAKKAKQE